ncbi:Putative peptidoglycan binding domain protein [Roseivivax sp. THAF40]|uniref:peptidoglycan-binding protein n=1 Tax=Roseivivax sp. THAF40 TaxID=2587858 RepID=UPI0012685799|nr:peptidoglycan-binding protein [Roseivivax sp. THAF40]QFT47800.1 Putative peptidoglycan binding domain protein [Roseivivax sp. THAF40]
MTFTKWLQSRLTAHGFPCGAIDGVIGPLTRAALKAFQAAKRIEVSGMASPETVTALRESATALVEPMPERDKHTVGAATGQTVWPRQANVRAFFGDVGERQTRIEVPWGMVLAWDTSYRVSRITVHQKVAESATRAMQAISDVYSEREIRDLGLHLFGGSLNVRRMRGGSRYSMHSWGIAIDFDPLRNGLRTRKPKARLSQDDAVPFWEAWEAEGWVSLGRAAGYDWMHVQAAQL